MKQSKILEKIEFYADAVNNLEKIHPEIDAQADAIRFSRFIGDYGGKHTKTLYTPYKR